MGWGAADVIGFVINTLLIIMVILAVNFKIAIFKQKFFFLQCGRAVQRMDECKLVATDKNCIHVIILIFWD